MTVPNDMENVQAFVFIFKLDLRRKSYRIFFKTLNCESKAGKKYCNPIAQWTSAFQFSVAPTKMLLFVLIFF